LSNDETQLAIVAMPLRPRPYNYCSSQRITLIFDIFRIGVVTGYREGMLYD